jgi:hypothetical protein
MGSDPVFRFLAVSPRTVRVPGKGADPFFGLTHNYTGDQGPRDSPHLYGILDIRGLAEAHRYLSERGIIATKGPRSTNNFKYLWSIPAIPARPRITAAPGCQEICVPGADLLVSAGICGVRVAPQVR